MLFMLEDYIFYQIFLDSGDLVRNKMSKQKYLVSLICWLKEYFDDKYVNEVKKKGYCLCVIFKIEEI